VELQFKIKETGKDSVLVRAALVDIVAWEDRFERPSSTMGGDSIFARDFVWLAWHSQKRTGATTLDFMDWIGSRRSMRLRALRRLRLSLWRILQPLARRQSRSRDRHRA
jgi:hypothetical protein